MHGRGLRVKVGGSRPVKVLIRPRLSPKLQPATPADATLADGIGGVNETKFVLDQVGPPKI